MRALMLIVFLYFLPFISGEAYVEIYNSASALSNVPSSWGTISSTDPSGNIDNSSLPAQNYFSARFFAKVTTSTSGTASFRVDSDDGFALWVFCAPGQVFNSATAAATGTRTSSSTPVVANVNVLGGVDYFIYMEYFFSIRSNVAANIVERKISLEYKDPGSSVYQFANVFARAMTASEVSTLKSTNYKTVNNGPCSASNCGRCSAAFCSVCCPGFFLAAINTCQLRACPANAANSASNPGCVCNAGYTGTITWDYSAINWSGSCSDVNECQLGTHSCNAAVGTCTNTPGSFTCACNTGYTFTAPSTCTFANCPTNSSGHPSCTCNVGYTGTISWASNAWSGSCADRNECVLGIHDCTTTASCSNTVGSFQCTCNTGYSGTGVSCSVAPCPANANGGPVCSCNAGYRQNPAFTWNTATQSWNGACVFAPCPTNSSGAPDCVCNAGYSGSLVFVGASWTGTCSDFNECTSNTHNCDPAASCTNNVGSFTCACNSGYSGAGLSCTLQPCPSLAGGAPSCSCNQGYASAVLTPVAWDPDAQAWIGACENVDECSQPKPCNSTLICQDLPGDYNCSACPPGFNGTGRILYGDVGCQDINECAVNPNICVNSSLVCRNTYSSYECVCAPGLVSDGSSCQDLDECTTGQHSCSTAISSCVNTAGSFTCSCNAGYVNSPVTGLCVDANECTLNTHDCQPTLGVCINNVGSFTCGCVAGYEPATATTCQDVNECSRNTHNCNAGISTCVNNIGSFTCSCNAGYTNNATGLCVDQNECVLGTSSCNATYGFCTNNVGSFGCGCNSGWTLQADGKSCLDFNECQGGTHFCGQTCANTQGSYACGCTSGWVLNGDGRNCDDVNECGAGTHSCDRSVGTCGNGVGSFSCGCNTGYVLNANGFACDDRNECSMAISNCNLTVGRCINTVGTFICQCNVGYSLQSNGASCLDNNECALGSHTCDRVVGSCINTQGSFVCSCPVGYTLTNGTTCVDINECQGAHNCILAVGTCTNNPGSYVCACNTGYSLNANGFTCNDIDECTSGTHSCDRANGRCTNSPGSFVCACNTGYTLALNLSGCNDNNECQSGTSSCNINNGTCTNTPGSFTCGCNVGFTLQGDGKTCSDNNECTLRTHNCDVSNGVCTNTVGSFTCSCATGWQLATGTSCIDVNECTLRTHNCDAANGVCSNNAGSFTCSCVAGWELGTGTSCVDSNECTLRTHNCDASNGVCNNTVGSFTCSCAIGWQLSTGTSCIDINECTARTHNCDTANGVCSNTAGSFTCGCGTGWQAGVGTSCIDLPECALGLHNCDQICVEAPGSFTCTCNVGYSLNVNRRQCDDLNECALGTHTCDRANGLCNNTVGSFVCSCNIGYDLISGRSCNDINECSIGTHNCPVGSASCFNNRGSFLCGCNDGYYGTGVICDACPIGYYDRSPGNATSSRTCTACPDTIATSTSFNETLTCQQQATTVAVASTQLSNCICPAGYQLTLKTSFYKATSTTVRLCLDVDECMTATSPCPSGSICINTCGSYRCTSTYFSSNVQMISVPRVTNTSSVPLNHQVVLATRGGETLQFSLVAPTSYNTTGFEAMLSCPAGGCRSPAKDSSKRYYGADSTGKRTYGWSYYYPLTSPYTEMFLGTSFVTTNVKNDLYDASMVFEASDAIPIWGAYGPIGFTNQIYAFDNEDSTFWSALQGDFLGISFSREVRLRGFSILVPPSGAKITILGISIDADTWMFSFNGESGRQYFDIPPTFPWVVRNLELRLVQASDTALFSISEVKFFGSLVDGLPSIPDEHSMAAFSWTGIESTGTATSWDAPDIPLRGAIWTLNANTTTYRAVYSANQAVTVTKLGINVEGPVSSIQLHHSTLTTGPWTLIMTVSSTSIIQNLLNFYDVNTHSPTTYFQLTITTTDSSNMIFVNDLVFCKSGVSSAELGVGPNTLLASDFTISMWFKSFTPNKRVVLLSNYANAAARFLSLILETDNSVSLTLYDVDKPDDSFTLYTYPVPPNKWHKIVVSRRETTVTLWVDGDSYSAMRAVINLGTSNTFKIGLSSPFNDQFIGSLSDIRFYSVSREYDSSARFAPVLVAPGDARAWTLYPTYYWPCRFTQLTPGSTIDNNTLYSAECTTTEGVGAGLVMSVWYEGEWLADAPNFVGYANPSITSKTLRNPNGLPDVVLKGKKESDEEIIFNGVNFFKGLDPNLFQVYYGRPSAPTKYVCYFFPTDGNYYFNNSALMDDAKDWDVAVLCRTQAIAEEDKETTSPFSFTVVTGAYFGGQSFRGDDLYYYPFGPQITSVTGCANTSTSVTSGKISTYNCDTAGLISITIIGKRFTTSMSVTVAGEKCSIISITPGAAFLDRSNTYFPCNNVTDPLTGLNVTSCIYNSSTCVPVDQPVGECSWLAGEAQDLCGAWTACKAIICNKEDTRYCQARGQSDVFWTDTFYSAKVKNSDQGRSTADVLVCKLGKGNGLDQVVIVTDDISGLSSPGDKLLSYAAPIIHNMSSTECNNSNPLTLFNCNRAGGTLTIMGQYFGSLDTGNARVYIGGVECTNVVHGLPANASDPTSEIVKKNDIVRCKFPPGNGQSRTVTLLQRNGDVSVEAAQLSYAQCAAGTREPRTADSRGFWQCSECPNGTANGNPGSTECSLCPAGRFSDFTMTRASCQPCDAGRFSEEGQSVCALCEKGKFQGAPGQQKCQDCNFGEFQSLKGQLACAKCDKGKFQNTTTQSFCFECVPGYYASESGLTACVQCAAGRFTNVTTSPDCADCLAGTYTNATGSIFCVDCEAGRVGRSGGLSVCSPCSPGTRSGPKARDCEQCEPGFFTKRDGAEFCEPCIAGLYQRARGQSDCDRCPAGSYSSNRSSDCISCLLEEYSEVASAVCLSCPIGKYSSGRTVCVTCEPGKFSNKSKVAVCNECEVGEYSSAAENGTFCRKCAPGYFSSAPGASVCTACDKGKFSNISGSDNCRLCPKGKFRAEIAGIACSACGVGDASNQDGAIECSKCSLGSYVYQGQRCEPCWYRSEPTEDKLTCICQKGYYEVPYSRYKQIPVDLLENQVIDMSCNSSRDNCVLCARCPIGANCTQSGTKIANVAPLSGYNVGVDGSNFSFFLCPLPAACTGTLNKAGSWCLPGYESNLCDKCAVGYGRSGSGRSCSACPDATLNTVYLVLAVCAAFVVLSLFVYWTVITAKEEISTESILIKIFLSGIQINSIAARLTYQWPPEIQSLLNLQKSVTSVGSAVVSPDCFTTEKTTIPTVYLQALLFAFFPFITWFVASAVVSGAYYYQKWKGNAHNFPATDWLVAAVVFVLFLAHPTITETTFVLFYCRAIGLPGTDEYLVSDLSQVCWNSTHILWLITVGIPMFVCFVLGIPLWGLILLNRQSHYIREQRVSRFDVCPILEMFNVCPLIAHPKDHKKGDDFDPWEAEEEQDRQIRAIPRLFFRQASVIATGLFRKTPVEGKKTFVLPVEEKKTKIVDPETYLDGANLEHYRNYDHRLNLNREFERMTPQQKERQLKSVQMKFAFMYKGYKHHLWFWEIVVTVRKIALVLVSVFFSEWIHAQALLMVGIVFLALMAHVYYRPFASSAMNKFEGISLTVSFLVFFLGQFLFLEESSSNLKVGCSMIIALAFIFFALTFLFYMIYLITTKLKRAQIFSKKQEEANKMNEMEQKKPQLTPVKEHKFVFESLYDNHGDEPLSSMEPEPLPYEVTLDEVPKGIEAPSSSLGSGRSSGSNSSDSGNKIVRDEDTDDDGDEHEDSKSGDGEVELVAMGDQKDQGEDQGRGRGVSLSEASRYEGDDGHEDEPSKELGDEAEDSD